VEIAKLGPVSTYNIPSNLTETLLEKIVSKRENMKNKDNYPIQTVTTIILCSIAIVIMLSACGGSDKAEPTTAPTVAAADTSRPDSLPSPNSSAAQETEADADADVDTADDSEAEGEGEADSSEMEDDAQAEGEADEIAYSGKSGSELWAANACVACHNLGMDQTADERGPVGPHMGNLHETASDRVDGQDAAEYVYTSIVEPDAYINEGYVGGVMPKTYTESMSEEEIRALTAWLLDPAREQ